MPHIWVKFRVADAGEADTEAHVEPLKRPRCFTEDGGDPKVYYCLYEDVPEERIEEVCRGAEECIRLVDAQPPPRP